MSTCRRGSARSFAKTRSGSGRSWTPQWLWSRVVNQQSRAPARPPGRADSALWWPRGPDHLSVIASHSRGYGARWRREIRPVVRADAPALSANRAGTVAMLASCLLLDLGAGFCGPQVRTTDRVQPRPQLRDGRASTPHSRGSRTSLRAGLVSAALTALNDQQTVERGQTGITVIDEHVRVGMSLR